MIYWVSITVILRAICTHSDIADETRWGSAAVSSPVATWVNSHHPPRHHPRECRPHSTPAIWNLEPHHRCVDFKKPSYCKLRKGEIDTLTKGIHTYDGDRQFTNCVHSRHKLQWTNWGKSLSVVWKSPLFKNCQWTSTMTVVPLDCPLTDGVRYIRNPLYWSPL